MSEISHEEKLHQNLLMGCFGSMNCIMSFFLRFYWVIITLQIFVIIFDNSKFILKKVLK